MTSYVTEEEQVEQIKAWIKEYGPTILLSVIAVVVITLGYRYWQQKQEIMRANASIAYEQMLSSFSSDSGNINFTGGITRARGIMQQFPKTPYASFAAFMITRNDVAQNNLSDALKQLQWVIDNSGQAALRDIARIRAARILLTQKQPNQAMAMLKPVVDKSFTAAVENVKGDIYLATNNISAAKLSYQQALAHLTPADTGENQLIQIKLDNLGTSVDTTAP